MAILYENYWPSQGDAYSSQRSTWKSQSFLAESTHTISSIKLRLKRLSVGVNTAFTVNLCANDGNLPGTVLATFGSFTVQQLTTSFAEYDFNDTTYEITSGVTYVISIHTVEEITTATTLWWTSTNSGYADGRRGHGNYSLDWLLEPEANDAAFKIYGPSPPDKAANPTPEHEDTEVDFSDLILDWDDSDGADTYDVFMGPSGSLVEVASDIIPSTFIVDLSDVPKEQVIYWRVDAKNEAGTTTGDVWNFDARPSKPANPSPTDDETDVAINKGTISWDASTPGPANTYDVYFGIKNGELTKVVAEQNVLEWRSPYTILNIKDYNPAIGSGLRSPQAGDVIYDGTDSFTITYIVVGDKINLQYQAKLYAFRTSGPGGKSPGDVLTNGSNVLVTLNDQWHFHGDVEENYLPPETTFQWRVDATNEFGTTTGDTWEFTAAKLLTIHTSYRLIPGGSGSGPYDYPPGVQGTDWEWTGENCVIAIKRLVAAANNKIWYEDI